MVAESGFSEIELRKFSEAGRTIAAAVGTSVELWARAEAGVILKTWAGKAKVSTQARADRSALIAALHKARRHIFGSLPAKNKGSIRPGEAGINLGFRGPEGRVYYRTRKKGAAGGKAGMQDVFSTGFGKGKHIAPADWPRVQSLVAMFRAATGPAIAAGRKAAGMSRQSIVQIADDLGIRLETVKGGRISAAGLAKARAAMASNGSRYVNGFAVVSKEAKAFYLTLVNRYPQNIANKLDRALAWTIQGRLRYFQRNLEEGTFLSAARAAKAYPYLEVLRTSG